MRRFARQDSICSRVRRAAGPCDAGFSTLEAIVAVGILRLCILPILDFQASVSDGAVRLGRKQQEIEALGRADAYLRAFPGQLPPQGVVQLGELQVSWTETLREPSKKTVSEQGAPGRFVLSVVRLSVEVRQQGRLIGTQKVDRLEWVTDAPYFDN